MLLGQVRSASVYELDKPLIIGEFASSCSEGPMTIEQQYADAYEKGYQVKKLPNILKQSVCVTAC